MQWGFYLLFRSCGCRLPRDPLHLQGSPSPQERQFFHRGRIIPTVLEFGRLPRMNSSSLIPRPGGLCPRCRQLWKNVWPPGHIATLALSSSLKEEVPRVSSVREPRIGVHFHSYSVSQSHTCKDKSCIADVICSDIGDGLWLS